jgi:type I restriction enzyme S subunit
MSILDVCKVYQPQTIATSKLIEGAQYDVFGANGCIGKYNQYNHEEDEVLLTCRGATCGNINRSTPKSWINGNAMVVHPIGNDLIKDFLVYVLKSVDFSKVITGAAQPQITRTSLSSVTLSIPPLCEQERIVSLLDLEFAKIDAIKANAEKQLQDAKDLFQSALKDLLTPKEGWVEKSLKEIGKTQTGCTPSMSNKDFYNENYIPFVKPAEINYDGVGGINYKTQMLSKLGAKKGRIFKSDSIFMVCIGATIGKLGISNRDISCNQQINVLTPDEFYYSRFVYYAMLNPLFNNVVVSEGTSAQATLPIISKGKWELLKVKIPPYFEQQIIANRLDLLQNKIKKLQSNYEQTITLCNDLKQSILKDIFG